MPLETLMDATNRLTAAGYDADFKVEDGQICAAGRDCRHPPEGFEVDEVVRFEGPTDPADESILFALRCEQHHVRGTYTAPYGPRTPVADSEAIKALEVGHAALPRTIQAE